MVGGVTGLFLALLAFDVHVTDTYFVVAHFHYIMVGGSVAAYLGAIHFWWPKMTGRMYSEIWARIAAVLLFIGFNATFFPQFILGFEGMPRRYHSYDPSFQVLNVLSSAGAGLLAAAYALPLIYLLASLRFGHPAPDNPWEAAGLEWRTTSPPPKHNFLSPVVVDFEAYDYPPEAIHATTLPDHGRGEGIA